jgi:hypothetical protein
MKTVQLIKVTQEILYYKDGELISSPEFTDKLLCALYGNTKELRSETVIETWRCKSKKEADLRFWEWMEENTADASNYYLVFIS